MVGKYVFCICIPAIYIVFGYFCLCHIGKIPYFDVGKR